MHAIALRLDSLNFQELNFLVKLDHRTLWKTSNVLLLIIEYSSTLYVGMAWKKMATNIWQACAPELTLMSVLKFHTCMATFTE